MIRKGYGNLPLSGPSPRQLRVDGVLIAAFLCLASGCDSEDDLLLLGGGGENGSTPTREGQVDAEETSIPQLCGGENHSCVLKRSGEVYCWGANLDGQLGDGTGEDRPEPVPVVDLDDASQLACGYNHSCALSRTKGLVCWGRNHHGQLGVGNTTSTRRPIPVSGLEDVIAMTAGADFTCALLPTGGVMCFGHNVSGQLGNGTNEDSSGPMAVVGLSDALEVTAGRTHACARRESGQIVCWGWNAYGQLSSEFEGSHSPSIVTVAGIEGATTIKAGGFHNCANTPNAVMCWGSNDHGQLGNGTTERSQATPVAVSLSTDRSQNQPNEQSKLSLGENFSCFVQATGEVSCWGYGGQGALGQGELRDSSSPVGVQGMTEVDAIAAGRSHACALQGNGRVRCWGNNRRGQIGGGERRYSAEARTITDDLTALTAEPSTIRDFPSNSSGSATNSPGFDLGFDYICALREDGKIQCFGAGSEGQLGHGATSPLPSTSGITVVGIEDAVQLSTHRSRACVCRGSGHIACWGTGASDFIANASLPTSTPVPETEINDCAEVTVGGSMTCVRHRSGSVSCWGGNGFGELGNSTETPSRTPVSVSGISDALGLAATDHTVCVHRQNGTVHCWGSGYKGTLGNGADTNSNRPLQVSALFDVTALAADYQNFCAIHSGGHVSCWGSNADGQLGNGRSGDNSYSNTPNPVRGLHDVLRIGLGGNTACAALEDGSARCWGANDWGRTGHDDANTEDVTTPWEVVESNGIVAGFGPYLDLECGNSFCCGLHQTGHLSCSGYSHFLAQQSAAPVPVPGFRLTLGDRGETPTPQQPHEMSPPSQETQPERASTTENESQTGEEATPLQEVASTPDAQTAQESPTKQDAAPRASHREPRAHRSCDCRNVQRECHIVYDDTGRPSEVCDCEPACCCR